MRRPPLTLALALALALTLLAPAARADDVDQARKHFAEGVQRYRDGDFEGARALFQQANAEHHAPAIVYNVARAEERLQHPQAAVEAYEAYIAEAGEKGELTQASVMAVARIRATAKQLHIESKPAGARIFIDGTPTRDPAPTRVLVNPGRHHVVAEGDGWHAEKDVEAGANAVEDITLARADEPAVPGPLPPPVGPAPPVVPPAPAPVGAPDGFVFGGEFVLVPHRFDHTVTRPQSSFGLAAGLQLEAGFAPSDQFAVMGRAMFAVGSKGAPATTIASIGVAFSYRILRPLWIGAAFQGGRALLPGAITPAPGEDRRFDTDYVFCPTLELSYAVIERPYGQWLVSIFPGYFFASPTDNDAFYVPIGFGLRLY